MGNMKKLIKQLKVSGENLTLENKAVFEDIVLYIRLSNIKTRDAEEFLQQLLDSILIGQEQGKTIETILGTKDMKEYCADIVAAYKSSYGFFDRFGEYFMYIGILLTWLSIIPFVRNNIFSFIKNGLALSNLNFNLNITLVLLVEFLILGVVMIIVSSYLKRTCFEKLSKKSKTLNFFAIWLVLFLLFAGLFLSYQFFNQIFFVQAPIYLVLPLALIIKYWGEYLVEK